MKVSTWGWCLAGLLALAAPARADELKVIEVSPEDHAAGDKLAELIREAFTRQARGDATPGEHPSSLCTKEREIILILDSAHDAVQLLRCRDGALLTRAIAPDAARETPYLAAFVAAELLDLNRELEDVRVQPLTAAERPQPIAAAAPPPLRSVESSARLLLSLGAEALLAGAPFRALPRPTFAVGLAFAHGPGTFSWLGELQVSLLAQAERQRGAEHLSLTRHDARLRAGLMHAFGPVALAALVHVRGSLTVADYTSAMENSQAPLRLGIGAGLLGTLDLADWALFYADASLELATSRTKYTVHGDIWAKDPELVVQCSLGLMLRARL
jgi:hypothetical protein